MSATEPYNPAGQYTIAATGEQGEVFHISYELTSEIRVQWLPDDEAHQPLNEMLAHISVLELDHLVGAATRGETFTVSALDDILPRPGWEISTRARDDPTEYRLQRLDSAMVHHGSRRKLLLLLELATRSAVAPHIGEPPPRQWVQRLRDVHPQILEALGAETLFQL